MATRAILVCALSVVAACHNTAPSPRADSAPHVGITFVPQGDNFTAAAREYDAIWKAEGPRIVSMMQRYAHLTFVSKFYADTAIVANVLERPSNSGFRESPMQLRASYPAATKHATLIHELGHRLQSGVMRREEDDHTSLFLWIYDVWIALYGRAFADSQVVVERARGGVYPAAWDSALALTAAQRAASWRKILAERLPTRR